MCRYNNIWLIVECYIGQVVERTFGDKLTLVNCNIQKNIVYKFIVCCLGETLWRLVVQCYLCFERKRGDNSTTNRVLKSTDRVLNIQGFHVFILNQ